MSDEKFIAVDLNLPCHDTELKDAETAIANLRLKLATIYASDSLDDAQHLHYYEEIMRILDYIGRLSMFTSSIRSELEQLYLAKFKSSPELAKQIWLDHYEKLHHPYNILKNRCFRMLDDLDVAYHFKFKKYPPNWKA